MTARDLYAVNEARERLGGISRNSLYALLRRGDLTSVVIGCRRFIPATSIDRFIAASASTVSPSLVAAKEPRPARPMKEPHEVPGSDEPPSRAPTRS